MAAGHSYFGTVNLSSAEEAHIIIEACRQGLLPRVTRRLTDEERIQFIRAGAIFVWEEEEAGIRRWTDNIKWSPSRVSGAFLTYSEIPARGDDTLLKHSFSSTDGGTKMHLICYSSKRFYTSGVPSVSKDPLLQRVTAPRSQRGAPNPAAFQPPPSSIFTPPFAGTSVIYNPAATPPPLSLSGSVVFTPSDWSVSLATFSPSPSPYNTPERSTSFPPVSTDRHSLHSLSGTSHVPSTSFHSTPSASTSTIQQAQTYDAVTRQLAPLHTVDRATPVPTPAPIMAALRGTFVDDEEDNNREANVSRGAEDERQLRLLGRSI